MHDEQIIDQVRQIMSDTFGIDESELPSEPSQNSVVRWTSVMHMVLLVALEEHFNVSFGMEDMISMSSLSHIVEVLRRQPAAMQV